MSEKSMTGQILLWAACSLLGLSTNAVLAEEAPGMCMVAATESLHAIHRSAIVIPEFSHPPVLNDDLDSIWSSAARLPLTFRPASDSPVPADTTVLAGHRGGVLYLRFELPESAVHRPCRITERDGGVWQDDGAEIFLAAPGQFDQPRHLLCNIQGVKDDSLLRYDRSSHRVISTDVSWNPPWTISVAPAGRRISIALPLSEIIGIRGERGDVIHLNLARTLHDKADSTLLYSVVPVSQLCTPEYFGIAVLGGPEPRLQKLSELNSDVLPSLIWRSRERTCEALSGDPIEIELNAPVTGILDGPLSAAMTFELHDEHERVLWTESIAIAHWPARIILKGVADGEYILRIRCDVLKLDMRIPCRWTPCLRVAGESIDFATVHGSARLFDYPRSSTHAVLSMGKDTSIAFSTAASSVYLKLPIVFRPPGPFYSDLLSARFRYAIDGAKWREVNVIDAPQLIPLAEVMSLGTHTISIESKSSNFMLSEIVFSKERLSSVCGVITTGDYEELLTDVKAELLKGSKVVHSEYVRSPHNPHFEIVGEFEGELRLRLTAAGWKTNERALTVTRGQRLDTGLIEMRREPGVNPAVFARGGYSKIICAAPGGSFTASIPGKSGVQSAFLVSRFKRVAIEVLAFKNSELGQWNSLGIGTFRIPAETPFDVYDLEVHYDSWKYVLPGTVFVRQKLPDTFYVAGCGHNNTWGQETAEYLQRIGELSELAGARMLLVANDVNAAYVSGALMNLHIPSIATNGNHSMARWDDFFGGTGAVIDDGPLRAIGFAGRAFDSWDVVECRLNERPEAKIRVVACHEGFAPLSVIGSAKINLLFDGHSNDPHPQLKDFPAYATHLRAPDSQSIRWIELSKDGVARTGSGEADCPVLYIPREGPLPLRVEFSHGNDGSASEQQVTIINEYRTAFKHARVRLLLAKGHYTIDGAAVEQQFSSDDARVCVIDIYASIAAQSTVSARVTRMTDEASK